MQPNRRTFLRQVGGGLATTSALLSACRAHHARAIEAAAPEVGPGESFAGLRSAYGLAPGLVYLNNASIGCTPNAVRDARDDYLRLCESNPWLYMWGGEWDEPKERSRRRAAEFLGCDSTELALTHNTTEAFNVLAHGLELEERDEVLICSITHIGARRAWEDVSRVRGFRVRSFEFPIARVREFSAEELVDLHAREIRDETRVLVLTDVDNIVGLRLPLAPVAAVARERGVEVIAVDGAQGAGLIPMTLRDLDIDVYATSTHKWLQTPKGMGLLYVRSGLQDHLRPMITTWGQREWGGDARRYEDYGTRNLPEVMTLAHAVDFQSRLGKEAVAAHRASLRAYARERVEADPRLQWRSPEAGPLASGLYAIGARDLDGRDVARRLFEEHQVVVRGFNRDDIRCLRVSPNVNDTEADLDRLFEALAAVLA